ncbi:MAG: Vitamin B12 dependent methionine synthase activation subunit [Clostridia bacterium]|nr:Vitamin B12 dependent methionine synthase activation subunit [Clostridia bacterium]
MIGPLTVRTYLPPPADRAEILRYARSGGGDPTVELLLDEMLKEAEEVMTYRVAYREAAVTQGEEGVTVGGITVSSRSLRGALAGAGRALLLAATLGPGIDRLLLRYGRLSPARALLLQAIGAERVEALLDAFTREAEAEYGRLGRRFSPGYGDLPLALQRELLPLLDSGRTLGLTLGASLLMSPTKSVTAIVGILDNP